MFNIKRVLQCPILFIRKQLSISELPAFPKENYKNFIPLFSNINAYLLTLISVYSTSLVTINTALIILILSSKDKDVDIFFGIALTLFISSLCFFIIILFNLIKLKKYALKMALYKDNNIETTSYKIEDSITYNILYSFFISLQLVLSMVLFLYSAVSYI